MNLTWLGHSLDVGSATRAHFRVGTIHVCLDGEQDAMALHCAVDVALMLLNLLRLVRLYVSGAASTSSSPARPNKHADTHVYTYVHTHVYTHVCTQAERPQSSTRGTRTGAEV